MKRWLIVAVVSRSFQLLSRKDRRKSLVIIVGIILNAILDVFGLATILPVMTVALEPELVQTNRYLNRAFTSLGYTDVDAFLLLLIGILVVIFALKVVVGLLIMYQQAKYSFDIAHSLSRRQYRYYFDMGYEYVRNIDTGNYLTNVRNIPMFYAIGVAIPLMNFFSEVVVVGLILIALGMYNVQLILTLSVLLGGSVALIYRLSQGRIHLIGEQKKILVPKAISGLNETVQSYVEISIFNKVSIFLKNYLNVQGKEHNMRMWESFFKMVPSKANEFIVILGIVVIFLYGIFFADNRAEMLIMLSLFAAAAYRLMPSLNRMLAAIMNIKTHAYTLDILESLVGYQESSDEQVVRMPFNRDITFSDLSFAYEDADTPVLLDLSLEVKKGEQVGFIGESGSGKTTLLRIILRLLHETEGELKVDGVPVDKENERSWQMNIGYVQQDVTLLEGTLLDNVAFGAEEDEIDLEKVMRVIEKARLANFVSKLPQGIYTGIGEFGSKLSGGQRQRIAIARALYKEAEVFVFDEATSALDSQTEMEITESINELARDNKTIFIVAHRITTLQGCDRIYELESGKIAGEYQYAELLKSKLGLVKDPT